jgi:hypothetical protein
MPEIESLIMEAQAGRPSRPLSCCCAKLFNVEAAR